MVIDQALVSIRFRFALPEDKRFLNLQKQKYFIVISEYKYHVLAEGGKPTDHSQLP